MNARSKGLQRVREVRKMLEGMGAIVEGPGYSLAFFDGSMKPIHRDYFGVADLISFWHGIFTLHQVTDLTNKAAHVKSIQEKGLSCWVWCKIERKLGYRIFFVTPSGVEEGKSEFKT